VQLYLMACNYHILKRLCAASHRQPCNSTPQWADALLTCHSLPEPDDLVNPQVLLEQLLNALLAQVGVATGVKQALLRHQ